MDVDSPLGINLTIRLQERQEKRDTVGQRHEEDIPLGFKRKTVFRPSISVARLTDDVLRNKNPQPGNSFFNCAITFGAIWSCLHKLFPNTNTHAHPHTFIECKMPIAVVNGVKYSRSGMRGAAGEELWKPS